MQATDTEFATIPNVPLAVPIGAAANAAPWALSTAAEVARLGLIATASAPSPGIAVAIDALAVDELPKFRVDGPVARVVEMLESLLHAPGRLPAQSWIVGDVACQARYFAAVTGTSHLALKLEVVHDDACR